jgi:hypothetical protein
MKDMLFKGYKNYEVLLDGIRDNRKSIFIGDVYWKQFIEEKTQKWDEVEFINWFGTNTNKDGYVLIKLIDTMEKTPDFDVIFSHISDLDSSVHIKSLSSQEAVEAVDRDQLLLTTFLEKIEEQEKKWAENGEDVTLIITSDHGLIDSGHGGNSANEKLSFLFAYSSRGFASNKKKSEDPENIFKLKKDLKAFDITEMTSYYMGFTPPFNSIGSFKLGFLPLYHFNTPSTDKKQEMTELEIAKLYSDYQAELLKQKTGLYKEHGLSYPDSSNIETSEMQNMSFFAKKYNLIQNTNEKMIKSILKLTNQLSYDSLMIYFVCFIILVVSYILYIIQISSGPRIPFIGEWVSFLSTDTLWKLLENTSEEFSRIVFEVLVSIKKNALWLMIAVISFIYINIKYFKENETQYSTFEKLNKIVMSYKFLRNLAFFLLNFYILINTLKSYTTTYRIKNQFQVLLKYLARMILFYQVLFAGVLFLCIYAFQNDNYTIQKIGTQAYIVVFIIGFTVCNLTRISSVQNLKEYSIRFSKVMGYLWLASITDPLFYDQDSETILIKPLNFIGDNLIIFGDIIPSFFLAYQIYN